MHMSKLCLGKMDACPRFEGPFSPLLLTRKLNKTQCKSVGGTEGALHTLRK